ncbi:MAG: M48 family metallopeptidase [Bacteroides sp.]|nr:M48 family metallopeptidase [Roseburia sp.]MCM1346468.1 M48 family metallopeptidase [Bacteroides sp.]MCM1420337.1 M48 family metallopeptidase [Bacteroides sp.]
MIDGWIDSELGTIRIVPNARARQIIIRAEADGIRVTVPPHGLFVEADVRRLIDENRPRLLAMREKAGAYRQYIDLSYSIDTDVMRLHLVEGGRKGFYINRKMGECTIVCPPATDFAPIQDWLKSVVVRELRLQAKVYLYNRTVDFARQYGFKVSGIKIQSSHTRWGSCSGTNSINLSLFLMAVPSRLSDYVIKHELCHTVHHDHSTAFWSLMDKVTDNQAHQLRKELAEYSKVML